MDANNLIPVTGRIQNSSPVTDSCDSRIITINADQGPVNLIVTPQTYVVNQAGLTPGMMITAFYDGYAPVPLIYPPQYQAVIVTPNRNQEIVTIRFFNNSLIASDNSLQLNLSPRTEVVTANGQRFTCRPGNRTLMVYYATSTRSIPPQTTPRKVIVF